MLRRASVVVLLVALAAGAASAAEYSGRLMLGAYQSQERHQEASAGQSSNDRRDALGRIYFDATGIGPYRNGFTLDIRDRYAEYGRVNDDRLVLVAANQPRVRQLAIKYPYERDRIFWSLGRMPVTEAGVDGVDGAEFGYRLSAPLQIGVFAGLIPQPETRRLLEFAPETRQIGSYLSFQQQGRDWFEHTYLTNALVMQAAPVEPEVAPTTIPVPPIPEPDSLEPIASTREQLTTAHWFHNGIFQRGKNLRITTLAHLNLAPVPYLQHGNLMALRQLSSAWSGSLSLLRIDLQEYRRTRDLREELAPSDYNQVRSDHKYKLAGGWMLLGSGFYGVRGLDRLRKTQLQAGAAVSQLYKNRLSTSFLAGYRQNFTSRDNFLRFSLNLYLNRLDVAFDQQLIIERHNDGRTLRPLISSLSMGYLVTQQILASFGGEYARDERVKIASVLATVGYRFSSRQLTPVRSKSPPSERVGVEGW